MAIRKTTDSPEARSLATDIIADRSVGMDDAADVVRVFESAEIETGTARLGGKDIEMQRVVLTSSWQPVK